MDFVFTINVSKTAGISGPGMLLRSVPCHARSIGGFWKALQSTSQKPYAPGRGERSSDFVQNVEIFNTAGGITGAMWEGFFIRPITAEKSKAPRERIQRCFLSCSILSVCKEADNKSEKFVILTVLKMGKFAYLSHLCYNK